DVTTTSGSGSSPRAASITQSTRRRPRSGCRCFGVSERMRVPSPAARTTAASRLSVTERELLGRQDSNLGSRDQNPLPYHLATPHKRHQSRSSLQNGGRGGKATTASTVGAASGASALGYAPQTASGSQFASKRPPRRQSHHGLDGRRRKRRLGTWLRPTNDISLAVRFKTAAAAAKPPRPRRSAPQAAPRHLATPHRELGAFVIREQVHEGDDRKNHD